jgi:hypothetical protein
MSNKLSDNLQAVNDRLLWPKPKPTPRSGLSNYFKGHREFQEPYRQPSLSPDTVGRNAGAASGASRQSHRAESAPPNASASATGRRGGASDPAKRSYPSQDNSLTKKSKRSGMFYMLEIRSRNSRLDRAIICNTPKCVSASTRPHMNYGVIGEGGDDYCD